MCGQSLQAMQDEDLKKSYVFAIPIGAGVREEISTEVFSEAVVQKQSDYRMSAEPILDTLNVREEQIGPALQEILGAGKRDDFQSIVGIDFDNRILIAKQIEDGTDSELFDDKGLKPLGTLDRVKEEFNDMGVGLRLIVTLTDGAMEDPELTKLKTQAESHGFVLDNKVGQIAHNTFVLEQKGTLDSVKLDEIQKLIKVAFEQGILESIDCTTYIPIDEFLPVESIEENEEEDSGFFAEEELSLTPNDKFFSKQVNLIGLGLERWWGEYQSDRQFERALKQVKVGIVDSGFNLNNAEFDHLTNTTAGVERGFVISNNVADEAGHGTQVLSVLAAKGENSAATTGVTWRWELSTVLVKATEYSRTKRKHVFPTENLIRAITHAVENGAFVINLSLGTRTSASLGKLESVIRDAQAKGVIFVCAAGNHGQPMVGAGVKVYPAALPNVVSVGNLRSSGDKRTLSSNYGKEVDVWAIGDNIYSINKNGEVATASGTSFSCPAVSGCVALLYADELKDEPNPLKPSKAVADRVIERLFKATNSIRIESAPARVLDLSKEVGEGRQDNEEENPVQPRVQVTITKRGLIATARELEQRSKALLDSARVVDPVK